LGAGLTLWLSAFASLLPGLFWLIYLERRAPQKAPWSRLVVAALGGLISVGLVFGFNRVWPWPALLECPSEPLPCLLYFCLGVGLVEELAKLLGHLPFWLVTKERTPWSGLLYVSACALGFATIENLKYVLESGEVSVLLGRSVLSTFAHVAMSGMWGYALSQSRSTLLEALFWSAFLHGCYDWFLFQGWWPGAIVVYFGLALVFRQRLQEARQRTQNRSRKVRECLA